MKYLDFTIQSLIMLGGLVLLIACVATESDMFLSIMSVQLYLGVWQLTSSLISVIGRAPHFRAKSIHLIISVIYLLSLIAVGNNGGDLDGPYLALKLYWIIPAWMLGIYYYIITWQWALPKKAGGGKFLPHINF